MKTQLEQDIARALQTRYIGSKIHVFEELPSTNDWAMARADATAENGEVVIATEQSAGKGRLGRHWFSPASGNLYCSILLFPSLVPDQISRLTVVAGVACSEALSQLSTEAIQLKWPNDLYYQGRKVGGILCESKVQGDKLRCAVVGIGINLHFDKQSVPTELKEKAIALDEVSHHPWDRAVIAAAVLNHFETWYERLLDGKWAEIVTWFDAHNILNNQQIVVETNGQQIKGTALGLDQDGHLKLQLENGESTSIIAGEATICS